MKLDTLNSADRVRFSGSLSRMEDWMGWRIERPHSNRWFGDDHNFIVKRELLPPAKVVSIAVVSVRRPLCLPSRGLHTARQFALHTWVVQAQLSIPQLRKLVRTSSAAILQMAIVNHPSWVANSVKGTSWLVSTAPRILRRCAGICSEGPPVE